MDGFNLIVSTYRFREEDAQDEILELLDKFGDQAAESEIIEIKGMILVQSSLDPFDVIDKLKELVVSEPWQVRYILRVLPVKLLSQHGLTQSDRRQVSSPQKSAMTLSG
ncbi:MAG: hypothetical protein M3136_06795 [Thermoproteota archaeon]|nr:hypothetical protein [Thermoproteota archaeon]